jgi:signal transduction histidine kinase
MTANDPVKKNSTNAREREQSIAELFHELTQPLTTLHCCLDLSLEKTPRSSKSQRDLQIALQQVEDIEKLFAQIRALLDTENHSQPAPESLPEPAPPLAWPSRCCR